MLGVKEEEMGNYKQEKEGYGLLFYVGIGLIALSVIFAVIVYFKWPSFSQITTFVASLVSSGGVALIIIALIESRHLQKSLEKTSDKIVDKSTSNFDNKLKETFKILEHSKYNGLIDILPPRQDEKRSDETKKVIIEEIKKSDRIYIFSISGLEFFAFPKGPRTAAGKYYSAIKERIESAKARNKPLDLKIKVLLIDPKCEAAKFRNQIETFDDAQGDIKRDIQDAIEGIEKLNTYAGTTFVKLLLYSVFPQTSFIITDSCIFIEPYHYAPTKELCNALKEKGLGASSLDSNCTGGRVPVLQFTSQSNMYIAMQKHFDSIWQYEEKRKESENREMEVSK
jgi:hypothetical protein